LNFISSFEFAIIIRFLLNRIVGQMNHPILQIFQSEDLTGSSYVAFFEPISFLDSILTRHKHITSDIEFSTIIQKGILNIQLYNIGFRISVLVDFLGLEDILNLLDVVDHCDSVPAVSHFSRLHYVNVLRLRKFTLLFAQVFPVTAHLLAMVIKIREFLEFFVK
jgi:hypothetical protein